MCFSSLHVWNLPLNIFQVMISKDTFLHKEMSIILKLIFFHRSHPQQYIFDCTILSVYDYYEHHIVDSLTFTAVGWTCKVKGEVVRGLESCRTIKWWALYLTSPFKVVVYDILKLALCPWMIFFQPRFREWSLLSGLVARMSRPQEIQERQTVSCNI